MGWRIWPPLKAWDPDRQGGGVASPFLQEGPSKCHRRRSRVKKNKQTARSHRVLPRGGWSPQVPGTPGRQGMGEEGAGDTVSLNKQSGPKSAAAAGVGSVVASGPTFQSLQWLRQAKRNRWVHGNSRGRRAACPLCAWPDFLSGREDPCVLGGS